MATQVITVTREEMTLSQLVWRQFKRQPQGAVEAVLELNKGLASAGVHLPVGTKIVMPLQFEADDEAAGVITLWD